MTINDLLGKAAENSLLLVLAFIGVPLIIFLYSKVIARKNGEIKPHKYVYSAFVYLTCIPGVFACVLTGYSMFFIRQNMLDANLLVYLLPIASMFLSLEILRKNVNLDKIPGFGRIKGLMVMLALAFLAGFFLIKLHFLVFFHSSVVMLFVFAFLAFLLFKWASVKLFK